MIRSFIFVTCVISVFVFTSTFAADNSELKTFELKIKDHKFIPSTIEAPSAKKFQLSVTNEDKGAEEFDSSDLNREKVIAPEKTVKIFLGPLQPGTYKFVGEYHEETAQGKVVIK